MCIKKEAQHFFWNEVEMIYREHHWKIRKVHYMICKGIVEKILKRKVMKLFFVFFFLFQIGNLKTFSSQNLLLVN